jgi:hypothetical protein
MQNWRCIYGKRKFDNGYSWCRGKVELNGTIVIKEIEHNHPPNFQLAEKELFKVILL